MKKLSYAAVLLLVGLCIVGCKRPAPPPKIVVSIASLTQGALLQSANDSIPSTRFAKQMQDMRDDDAMLSSSVISRYTGTYAFGHCCPCPPEVESVSGCQCFMYELRNVISSESWAASVTYVKEDASVINTTPTKLDGGFIIHSLKEKLPEGNYTVRMSATFKSIKGDYNLRITVDKDGKMIRVK